MKNIFQKAVRKKVPVIISLAGRSGSGKTMSSILLARGLVGPTGRIAVADTERGRASLFANKFDYDVFEVPPPYTPEAFINIITIAEREKYDCLILDSLSHEWSGIGGIMDQASKSKLQGGLAWARPKVNHKKLVDKILQSNVHLICSLRAEHKLIVTDDPIKKTKIFTETEDLIPEQEKRFIYEMTISATIDEKTHFAKFTKLPDDLANVLKSNVMIDQTTGELIRTWADAGVDDPFVYDDLFKAAQAAALSGIEYYRDYFESLKFNDQKALTDNGDHEKFKQMATDISAQMQKEEEPDEAADQSNETLFKGTDPQ